MASGSDDLRQEVAPKLSSALPQGWSLTLDDNVFTLRRDGKVFLYNPVGMPAFGKLEDNVREFGVEGEYTIKLRFEPLLSKVEYERLKREREPFEKVVNEGARTKDEWGKGVGEYHKRPLPVYFTNRYSIFAERSDMYPLRVYPKSVAVESQQVVASLDSLFRRYEEKAGRNSDF